MCVYMYTRMCVWSYAYVRIKMRIYPYTHIRVCSLVFMSWLTVFLLSASYCSKEKLDIERAHRVKRQKTKPGQANQNHPRTIVCRLRDWKQREQVLRKARREKPSDIYISEDLSPATLQKREPQIPKLKAAKQAGKIAYFVLDRLVIRDKPPSD